MPLPCCTIMSSNGALTQITNGNATSFVHMDGISPFDSPKIDGGCLVICAAARVRFGRNRARVRKPRNEATYNGWGRWAKVLF